MSPMKTFRNFIKIIWKAYPKAFVAVSAKCLIHAAQTLYVTMFVSGFLWCLERGGRKQAAVGLLFLVLSGSVIALFRRMVDAIYEVRKERLKERLDHLIFDKISQVPYQCLEDTAFLDLVNRAKFCIQEEDCIDAIFRRGFQFLQNLVIIVILSAALLDFHVGLFLLLLSVAVINVLLYLRFVKIESEYFQYNMEIDRKYIYYLDTLLYPGFGKDFRFYPVGRLLIDKFSGFSDELTRQFAKYGKKELGIKGCGVFTKYVAMGICYAVIFWKAFQKKLSISSFSFYLSASTTFLNMITESIENMLRFFMFLKYAKPFVELLEFSREAPPEESKEPFRKLEEEITSLVFRNVTFSYPNAKSPVLKNISFQLQKGEKISIVGLNGAGKTTIVKLICRLYQPDTGEILVNGIPINEFDYVSYISQISTLFQDFRLLAFSLQENILGGECKQIGGEAKAWKFAELAGLQKRIQMLSQGMDSIYSKDYEEGGIELSGGEQQRLALARMLAKESSLLILDEPTAAMDPYAEAEFYDTFQKMAGERMVIYISHRMSASIFSDKILVLEHGMVADFDSHANLMKKRGRYQELFQIQADHYQ